MWPEDVSISIGDESIPVSMECEVEHMTLDAAIASGLFDVPDEPGMVQTPVMLDVCIPNHVLWPARPTSGVARSDRGADGVPPWDGGRPPRRRFGNYPKAIAAQNIARSFRTTPGFGDAAEARAFGDMLRATQRGSAASVPAGPEASGVVEAAWPASLVDTAAFAAHPLPLALRKALSGAPVQLARAEEGPDEEEGRSLLGGPAEELAETARRSSFGEAFRELRDLEPNNPALTILRTPDWVPDDAAVARMEGALAAARARHDPSRDQRSIDEELGLRATAGAAANGSGNVGLPRMASFRGGESDGGVEVWDTSGQQYPKGNPEAAAYQQAATGAPANTEYKIEDVSTDLMPSGVKFYDGFDPQTGNLIEAKAFTNWPTERFPRSMVLVAEELENDARIAGHFGRMLEVRVKTEAKADMLRSIIESREITNIIIKYSPVE